VLVGTGKSLLLKAIITALKKKHASKPEVVSVTASTGMAASNIGGAFSQLEIAGVFLKYSVAGMTLHSWGAIAPSVNDVEKLLSYIRMARPALLRWKQTQVLIIDEGTQCSSRKLRRAHSSFYGQSRWWMGTCSRRYPLLRHGSGRRLTNHLVASK
jgi:hypothetical protein